MVVRDAVVCDKIEEIEEYCARRDYGQPILCLTKNPEIYDYALENKKNIMVKYLEASKTQLDYMDVTYEILDTINKKIECACSKEYRYLYMLGCSMDMGDPSKQILDAVMIRDMLNDILNAFEITSIECYYHEHYVNEIEALYFWKKTRKCTLKIVFKGDAGNSKGRLQLLTRYGSKVINCLTTLNAQRHYLRSFFDAHKKKITKVSSDIGIIQHGGRQKNYNWTIGYLKELEQADISFHMIGTNSAIAEQWRRWGYGSDSPADYIDKKVVLKTYLSYRKEKNRVKRYLKKSLKDSPNELLDNEQLRMILQTHLDYKVFDAAILDSSAEEYFKTHDFKIIDLNATSNYLMSKICYYNVKRYNQKTKFKSGVRDLRIMARGERHEPFGFIVDFEFIIEESNKKIIGCEDNLLRKEYIIKNTSYTDEFYTNMLKEKIFGQNLRVLWAPSYPALGVTHFSSFMRTGESLFDFFKHVNKETLYVKFHPNQLEQEIRGFYVKYQGNENIHFSNKEDNIISVMGAVDIVVTNCSLTIIDAVVQQKAVICVVDKIEYQLVKQHEEGICIVTDVEKLLYLLKELQAKEEYRKQWILSCIERQNIYFSKYIASKDSKNERMKIMRKELEDIVLN